MNIYKTINKEIIELKKILNNIDGNDLKVLNLLCREAKKAIKKTRRLILRISATSLHNSN